MHILHIANDFRGSKVHVNLFERLAKQGVEQTIYCPVRSQEDIGRNSFSAVGTEIVYDYVIKPYHRFVYHVKRRNLFKSIQSKVDLNGVELCHAATLFSDGGLAYLIYKKYHIPYVVAVRNVDVNDFLGILPNTWAAGRRILLNAKKIFFISKALMEKFSNHPVIKPILPLIQDKFVLIPNGIDDYFLEHINHTPHFGHKVLYVGDFSDNKNVVRLGKAIMSLKKEAGFEDLTLTVVGGGKNTNDNVQKMMESHPETFTYLGPIYDKDKLCEVFNNHSLFAMPSIYETFGLVYLEALSQNLPVLYTKGQGIDKLFDDSVGIGVNPLSVDEIKNAIKTIISYPQNYSNKKVDFEQFNWNNIVQRYCAYYNEVLNLKTKK